MHLAANPVGPALAPQTSDFEDTWSNRPLLKWYSQLDKWHSYLRFLGLPNLRDNPDVTMDTLYIPPAFAAGHISPDRPPKDWPATIELLPMLLKHQRLVLLGDPGSGKSALISWITTLCTSYNQEFNDRLHKPVPAPIILRDLSINTDITWDSLWAAFLAQDKNLPLKGELPASLLDSGQVIIMLDGLDEIGDLETRRALRDAVYDGMRRFPRCRWLLTSRIVGYDQLPFHLEADSQASCDETPEAAMARPSGGSLAEVQYLAPFDNPRIERFAHAWYHRHDLRNSESSTRAGALVQAISGC